MTQDLVRQAIVNGAVPLRGVSFPGLGAPQLGLSSVVEMRGAVRLSLRPGDLLSVESSGAAVPPAALAWDGRGAPALDALGLTAEERLDPASFDAAEILGWLDANGAAQPAELHAARLPQGDAPLVLKAERAVHLWIVLPQEAEALVAGKGAGTVEIALSRPGTGLRLPDPLGEVREEFTIPRGTGMAYRLEKGESVQILDVEGQQCSDFMAFRAEGLERGREQMIDGRVTRTMVRGAYPGPGLFDKYYDAEMHPLLGVTQDTVGRHDTFALACTARGYEDRGFPGHVNCSDNISDAMDPFGVHRRSAWPAINLFFNSWIDHSDNRLRADEAWSRPGDHVVMRALDDLVCVSTACPDDIDPINGWNPTDIHIRIYRPDAPIRRSVVYRETETAVPAPSEETAFHPRTSALARDFRPARNLWVPGAYTATGAIGEYWACRETVTLQDSSGLRKFDVKGADAERLLQLAMTKNIAKLPVHRGLYALICDDTGTVVDDGTLFRLAPDLFRWCCGTEESARILIELARTHGLRARIEAMRGALPSLALQGPLSREVLRSVVFTSEHVPSLDEMRWFGVTQARLRTRDGAPFMLSRTGYTGELGYEIFTARAHAVEIWDALMEAGQPHGIRPLGSDALDMLRIEAGLMAAGAEFAPGIDAWEAGLGFAVNMKKPEFQGRAALERNAGAPRRALVGLILDGSEAPSHGDAVLAGDRPVGTVTSATVSPTLECAIAMARIAVEHAETGTTLEIGRLDGRMKRLAARVTGLPFLDPERKRPRA